MTRTRTMVTWAAGIGLTLSVMSGCASSSSKSGAHPPVSGPDQIPTIDGYRLLAVPASARPGSNITLRIVGTAASMSIGGVDAYLEKQDPKSARWTEVFLLVGAYPGDAGVPYDVDLNAGNVSVPGVGLQGSDLVVRVPTVAAGSYRIFRSVKLPNGHSATLESAFLVAS